MPQTFPACWLRIAGHSLNIKSRQPMHWRCYVKREEPVVPLADWSLVGSVDQHNFIQGTAPDGDHLGLIAWIDVYGILSVDERHHAVIELLPAPV